MLIACKCLNVTVNVAPAVGNDDLNNHKKGIEINLNFIQQQQQSKIKGDHLQFFEKVGIRYFIQRFFVVYFNIQFSIQIYEDLQNFSTLFVQLKFVCKMIKLLGGIE